MGRRKIYHTEDERREAQRKWQMEYYERNKERLKKEAREKYRLTKINQVNQEKSKDIYGER